MKRIGLIDLLGTALLLVGLQLMPSFAGDPGVGWHLASGRWIVEHRSVPFDDPFLSSSIPKEWIHNQWLSDVVLWALFSLGGWQLLQVVAIGIVVAIVTVVLPGALIECRRGVFAIFFSLLLGLLYLSVQWFLRPVLVSFLLFAILYRLKLLWFEHRSLSVRHLLIIGGLFALWANLHPGFFMGWLLLGVAGLASLFSGAAGETPGRRLVTPCFVGVELFVAIVATFINPYGVALHREALKLIGNHYFMNLNQEWFGPQFELAIFAPAGAVVLLVFFLLGRRPQWRVNKFELLSFLLFLFLALEARRNIPFLGVVTVGLLSALLTGGFKGRAPTERELGKGDGVKEEGKERGDGILQRAIESLSRKERKATRYRLTLAVWGGLAVWSLITPRLSTEEQSDILDRHFPARTVRFLGELRSEVRLFHTPNWGGYLTFKLWPKIRPFIDDRNELNGRAMYEEFFELALARPQWRTVLEKYRFNTLLLEPTTPLRFLVERLPEWELVYRDEQALIYALRGDAHYGGGEKPL